MALALALGVCAHLCVLRWEFIALPPTLVPLTLMTSPLDQFHNMPAVCWHLQYHGVPTNLDSTASQL